MRKSKGRSAVGPGGLDPRRCGSDEHNQHRENRLRVGQECFLGVTRYIVNESSSFAHDLKNRLSCQLHVSYVRNAHLDPRIRFESGCDALRQFHSLRNAASTSTSFRRRSIDQEHTDRSEIVVGSKRSDEMDKERQGAMPWQSCRHICEDADERLRFCHEQRSTDENSSSLP